MSLSKIKDPDADPDAADKSKWTPNTKFHVEKLQIFCRVCSEPRALSSDRFPISKKAYSNEIEEIWQVNVLADNKTVHPPYICRACIIKMEK